MKLLDYEGLQYFYSKLLTKFNAITTSISNITNGTTKVGNADKLDGNDSSYYATASALSTTNSNVTKITNGTTKAGDADKLDGYHASDILNMFVSKTSGGTFSGDVVFAGNTVLTGATAFTGPVTLASANNEEGGEIVFSAPLTGHSFGSAITQDICMNYMRIFATHDSKVKILLLDFNSMKSGNNNILHSGNSAQVIINDNAPANMDNVLWVVP